MWCERPTAGTGQATQAGASLPAARARKGFSRPPAPGLVSRRAFSKRAGCAGAGEAGARTAAATSSRIPACRSMARSVLFRAVRTDRDRPVDRREAHGRRCRIAELDPPGILVPVLPRSRAGSRAALEGGAARALDEHAGAVSFRKRERQGAGARMGLQPSVPAAAGEVDGDGPVLRLDVDVSAAAGDADRAVDRLRLDGVGAFPERDGPVLRVGLDRAGRILERKWPVLGAGCPRAGDAGHGNGPVADLEVEGRAAGRPAEKVHEPVAVLGAAT